jgi:hypothetical protein
MRTLAVIVAGLGLVSCTAGELRLTGRACPCLDGWECDESTNTCVQSVGSNDGAIDVTSFSAGWSTPEWIRWEWSLDGVAEDFAAFELVVGTSREDVLARENVRIVTGEENPELDRFELPWSEGIDPVVATHTDGHLPDTEYYAQLVVIDTAGEVSTSRNIAQQRTGVEIGSIPIYDETTPPPGFVIPACLLEQTEGAHHEGSASYAMTVYCEGADEEGVCSPSADGSGICYTNMNLNGMAQSLEKLVEGNFDDAFLEFSLRIDDSPNSYWASVGIQDGPDDLAVFAPVTFRADGAYRTHQIPLEAFGKSYASYAEVFEGVTIGGQWGDGATVRVDSIYIRW